MELSCQDHVDQLDKDRIDTQLPSRVAPCNAQQGLQRFGIDLCRRFRLGPVQHLFEQPFRQPDDSVHIPREHAVVFDLPLASRIRIGKVTGHSLLLPVPEYAPDEPFSNHR